MEVVFVSNYLNHHQIPFCVAMDKLTNGNFHFLAMEEMSEDRKNMGWDFNDKFGFQIDVNKNRELATQLVNEADVVMCGGNAYMNFIRKRVEDNKLTFWCSERIYKRGLWRVVSPRGLYYMTRDHGRYRKKNIHLLCASAYAPLDFSLTGSYIGKTYKWGYFPEFKRYDANELMSGKEQEVLKILWVSRFIKLKHPEYPIKLAEFLKKKNYDFLIEMVGNGHLLEEVRREIRDKNLSDVIFIKERMTPQQVRKAMEASNIFIFTSDYNEGWGAVLNESMNSGCAVVASHAIGATPYLLEHNVNGLIYKNGNFDDFAHKVECLIRNKELCTRLGKAAYFTIENEWNSDIAAQRFYNLCESKLSGKDIGYNTGPCSRAKIMTSRWFKKIIK